MMPIFVVQFHKATHDHYDFRLEIKGVLKSWAIPKQPPRKKGIKRLAIAVEDHSLNYAKFEGKIIEGYGKGTVKIWDKGTYKLEDKKKDKIVFYLNGKKLNGKYVLIKTKFNNKRKNSWLFFKV
jgi:DNA ligase D-like protein (predicted 3'-phosphoesterase)|tara:strand:+ start:1155 stop:1526 length:372 start_codon:yes stop_codon:yes gene_type:complete